MRKHRSLLWLSLSAQCLFSCGSSLYLDKPSDTNLAFWITEKVSTYGFQLSNCTYLPGMFGGSMYLDGRYEAIKNDAGTLSEPEVHVVYTVTAYPDYAYGGQYVTRIDITDPEIYVYGLTFLSSESEVSATMEKLGFTLSSTSSWKKNNCTFSFGEKGISIKAFVSNKYGIQF